MENFEPLAVIGMGCHLPGARNLDEYWELLIGNRSAISLVPESRFDRELYFTDKKGIRGKSYMSHAGLVDYPAFDQSVCEYPINVMKYIEIGHLMMVQTAAMACRHAGLDPFDLPIKNTGVYIGNNQSGYQTGNLTYAYAVEEAAQYLMETGAFRNATDDKAQKIIDEVVTEIRSKLPRYGHNGFPTVAFHVAANAVSDALHLNGPSMILDAACSSSLKALSLASQDISLGNIEMAVVGGSSFFTSDSLLVFSNAQAGSMTGSFPFSEKADGLISAEGYAAIIVKSLDRALADGDPIQAIVRGIGISSDGRGKSLWAPRKEGQVKAIQRAYQNESEMGHLDYLEAHATSTHLGDLTELEAMGAAFCDSLSNGKIPVGSVKANIGHALEASGVASLIKAALVLQHEKIPGQINSQPLNADVDWENLPFYVPVENRPLPKRKDGKPRRAAINAFGIGGMNAHVVIEEVATRPVSLSAAPATHRESPREPIAVIGIGALLPGARTAGAFTELLFSGTDPSSEADGRWNTQIGYSPKKTNDSWKTSGKHGAFLKGFKYDWKRHKIPPKHIDQADPLQFMILDCVDAALADAGYVSFEQSGKGCVAKLPTQTTGVIVGSMFETDNSSQLCMGYRLPHFQRELRRALIRNGIDDESVIREILKQYVEVFFKRMPAFLDETGSFTPSSLASRITKTYDLMGGSATINTGETVGLAAVMQAVNSLQAGRCDVMICVAGSQSTGLSQFIRFDRTGRLSCHGNHNLLDAEADGQILGEGAGALILKRLSDAERDGDRIYSIIRGVGASYDADPEIAFTEAMERAWRHHEGLKNDVFLLEGASSPRKVLDAELASIRRVYGEKNRPGALYFDRADSQVGHTLGASGMVSLIKANAELENLRMPKSFHLDKPSQQVGCFQELLVVPEEEKQIPVTITPEGQSPRVLAGISSWDPCGSAYHLVLERGTRLPIKNDRKGTIVSAGNSDAGSKPSPSAASWRIVRLHAATKDELSSRIERSKADADSIFTRAETETEQFPGNHPYRLAVVADSPSDLKNKLDLASKLAFQGKETVLAQKGIFVGQAKSECKVAFLFSGQGSQYSGMLQNLTRNIPAAQRAMDAVDRDLAELGLPPFKQIAWQQGETLGKDVFQTQLSLLCADTILLRTLESVHVAPDVVAGHSFGEFPALHAAGAWTFREAIRATKLRCEVIAGCRNAQGGMLSTNWDEKTAHEACRMLNDDVYVANINAPDQTILGGKIPALEKMSRYIASQGGTARMISVPRPFHTILMDEVRQPLFHRLGDIETKRPAIPFLSSVTNSFVSDPAIIRSNLSDQMIAPVRYVELVRGLLRDGVGLFVECGPGTVLTSLHRRILGDDAIAVAVDQKQGDGVFPLLCVRACVELYDARFSPSGRINPPQIAKEHVETDRPVSSSADLQRYLIDSKEFERWNRSVDGKCPIHVNGDDYVRFVMRVVHQPLPTHGTRPCSWNGRALILGDNDVAAALAKRIESSGGRPIRISANEDRTAVLDAMERHWREEPFLHLFVTTPFDADAKTDVSELPWNNRRDRGVFLPFFVTQKWMQLVSAAKLVPQATFFAATVLGGDFGFRGRSRGVEGGALSGLLKSLFLEGGMATDFAFRSKQVDFSGDEAAELCAKLILDEYAANIPFEMEVGYIGTERYLIRPIPQTVVPSAAETGVPAGSWIVTGGARGITALAGSALSKKFGIKLFLLGSSELPKVDSRHHDLSETAKKELKTKIMKEAVQRGEKGPDAWNRFLRELELDASLQQLKKDGVDFQYYRCDISNRRDVEATLQSIRQSGATITGILHGAGYERSCRIEKKSVVDVEKTFKIKTDGAAILMDLTRNDPIRHFLAFGSLSGHTGSIGQSDYCMANDALAKLCDWYQVKRPECRVICYHWGPWAEVGMAARPEMLNNPILASVQHVRPEEGIRHLLNEIAAVPDSTEILMLDWSTYKLYHSDQRLDRPYSATAEAKSSVVDTEIEKQTKPSGSEEEKTNDVQKSIPTKQSRTIAPAVSMPAHAGNTRKIEDYREHADGKSAIRRMIVRWVDGTEKRGTRELIFRDAVLVLGSNRDAVALTETLREHGVRVVRLDTEADRETLLRRFDDVWTQYGSVSHLFLMTGRDPQAVQVAEPEQRKKRMQAGFMTPLHLTQQWLKKISEANMMNRSVLVAATAMNGDFGISSGTCALESAGIGGLIKSIHLEHGGSDLDGLSAHIVDFAVDEQPDRLVADLLTELTLPGFDIEVAYIDGQRRVPRLVDADPRPVASSPVKRGSTWVFTGGARGITAEAAKALGARHGLKLHLLGSSPRGSFDERMISFSEDELKRHKKEIVRKALSEGKLPDKEWTRFSNAMEMERNLRDMERSGIDVTYHQCDLLDDSQIKKVFAEIARRDGPIYGIVHGAGLNGNPTTVKNQRNEHIALTENLSILKVNAVLEMLRQTDPQALRFFVGFASISGRFGSANAAGYSASNEMLCKIMGRLNRESGHCRAVGIHWHGWDNVGMMMRPNSTGAVKVLKMQLLAPTDGVEFLIRELEAGLPENEIVVSDSQYYSIFRSSEMHVDASTRFLPEVASPAEPSLFTVKSVGNREKTKQDAEDAVKTMPLITRLERTNDNPDNVVGHCTFRPKTDPFLLEHKFRGRPMLPAVMTIEAFLETARLAFPEKRGLEIHDLELLHGLRFPTDNELPAQIVTETTGNLLCCELIAPAGKLVPRKTYAKGFVQVNDRAERIFDTIPTVMEGMRHPITYADDKALMYHGPVFRHSREAVFTPQGVWTTLKTLPLADLAGHRGTEGWLTHPATIDACLYMCGVCVWLETGGSIALPHGIQRLKFGRLPKTGEQCLAYLQFRQANETEAFFNILCHGEDGTPIFEIENYCCRLVPATVKKTVEAKS